MLMGGLLMNLDRYWVHPFDPPCHRFGEGFTHRIRFDLAEPLSPIQLMNILYSSNYNESLCFNGLTRLSDYNIERRLKNIREMFPYNAQVQKSECETEAASPFVCTVKCCLSSLILILIFGLVLLVN